MTNPPTGIRFNARFCELVQRALGPQGSFASGVRALMLLGAAQLGAIEQADQRELLKLLGDDLAPEAAAALQSLYWSCATAVAPALHSPQPAVSRAGVRPPFVPDEQDEQDGQGEQAWDSVGIEV